ncbi:MAG: HNH endonuclease [Acetobacteraceae bacterium]|jgi:5-methylcytosine-specific restriction protein A
MTGRSVPEWIGRSPDAKPPTSVRVRVFERHGGRCHLTGQKIGTGDRWELDHVKPLALGGENREQNLAPALYAPHREKAAAEKTDVSKADRIRLKHTGGWPRSKRPIRSRGFGSTRLAYGPIGDDQ